MGNVPRVLVRVETREGGQGGDLNGDQRVGWVTVNNPDKRNALGNEGKRALAEAIEQLADDDDLRAIVLTGAGDTSFIGGADISEM